MHDDPPTPAPTQRAQDRAAAKRRRPLPADQVTENLRRAYAAVLAEPLPDAITALLRRLG